MRRGVGRGVRLHRLPAALSAWELPGQGRRPGRGPALRERVGRSTRWRCATPPGCAPAPPKGSAPQSRPALRPRRPARAALPTSPRSPRSSTGSSRTSTPPRRRAAADPRPTDAPPRRSRGRGGRRGTLRHVARVPTAVARVRPRSRLVASRPGQVTIPPPATTDLQRRAGVRRQVRRRWTSSSSAGRIAPVAGAADARAAQRRVWGVVGTLTTDADGRAEQELVVARTVTDNAVRVTTRRLSTDLQRHDRPELRRRDSRVVVGGRSAGRRARGRGDGAWTTPGRASPVRGSVQLFRSLGGRRWGTLRTDDRGRARITTSPRLDSRWRARAVGQDWVAGGWSDVHRVEEPAARRAVRLPPCARPRRRSPPQARGATDGPTRREAGPAPHLGPR